MIQQNTDLNLLRRMNSIIIDLLEAERQHNTVQDSRLEALEQKYNIVLEFLEIYQNQSQDLQSQLATLDADLRIITRSQADKIAELECLESHYSLDGEAICNLNYLQEANEV